MSTNILINFLSNGHAQRADSSISPSPAWDTKSLVTSGMQWWKFRSDIVAGISYTIPLYPTFREQLPHTFFWMGRTKLRMWNCQRPERASSSKMVIRFTGSRKGWTRSRITQIWHMCSHLPSCVLHRHRKAITLFHPGNNFKILSL